MDTEFPGVVARPIGEFKSTSDYQYQVQKMFSIWCEIIQDSSFPQIYYLFSAPEVQCGPLEDHPAGIDFLQCWWRNARGRLYLAGLHDILFIGPRCPWGPIYGSWSLKLTTRLCWDLTDVTLADEDSNSTPADVVNRAILGNVAMQVAPPGGQNWN